MERKQKVSNDNGKSRALIAVDEHEVVALMQRAKPMWPAEMSQDQARAVATLALSYGLDPLAGELIVYQGKPYVTVDGRLRKARESGKWQGIIEDRPATPDEYKALHVNAQDMLWFISIKHADWIRPNGAYGRVKVSEDRNPVARQHPAEVARKRGLYRCLREAFGVPLPGIYEDENVSTAELADTMDVKPSVNTMVSQGQITALHIVKEQLGLTDEQYRTELRRFYCVESSTELTEFQAQDLLDAWTDRLEARQKPKLDEETRATIDDVYGTTYEPKEQPKAPPQRPTPPAPAKVVDEPQQRVPWNEDEAPAEPPAEPLHYSEGPLFFTAVAPNGVNSNLWGKLGQLCEEAKAAGVLVKDFEPKTATNVAGECTKLRKRIDTELARKNNARQASI